MKTKRGLALFMAVCMAAGSILSGCGKEAEEEGEDMITVEVVTTSQNNIEVSTQFMGTVEPQEETAVFAKVSGEVTQTFFEVGDHVNEGDVLFTLDDEAAQMQVRTAQANYASAQAGVAQQLGSEQLNRDNAENTLETAQEGRNQINGTYGYYSDQYSDLEEQKSDLEEDKDDMEDDKKKAKKKLSAAKDELAGAKTAAEAATKAYNEGLASGVSGNDLTALKEAMDNANSAVTALNTQISTLNSTIASYKSGIKTYESSIDSIESSEKTIGYQMSNLGYSAAQADRGSAIAQESLDYYNNVTAPATRESAQATMQSAQVGLDSAQLQLDYTKVTAPVSGVIEEKNVDKYDMAAAGVTAYVITNKESMLAKFYVTETAYKSFTLGQEVTIERNGTEYTGYISELPVTIDSATGLFEVKATINGDASQLVDGTSVKLVTRTSHVENVMTIPVDCVYYESEKAYIYTVTDGIVSKDYIEVGLFDDENIQVISGVEEGTEIISSWSSELRDGLEVNTEKNNQ